MINHSKSQNIKFKRDVKIQLAAVVLPLAIVCLAIAFALAFAGASFSEEQRWLLTAFLILFPIASLSVSGLILFRQQKFANFASREQEFSWTPFTPEQQRQKLTREINRIISDLPEEEQENFPLLYVTLKDLALRHIEAENYVTLRRNIVLEGLSFDGVAIKNNYFLCVEVVVLVMPDLPQKKVDELLEKVQYAANRVRQKNNSAQIQLLLAVVTSLSFEEEKQLRSSLAHKFALTPVNVDIRFFSQDFLEKTFISE